MLTALAGAAVPLRPRSLVLLLAARREERLRAIYALQLQWLMAAQLSALAGAEEFTFPEPLAIFPMPRETGAPADMEAVRRRVLRRLNQLTRKE